MFSTNNEESARKLASEHNLRYGWSVFPPTNTWYVGTAEQLTKIGVMDPLDPTQPEPAPKVLRLGPTGWYFGTAD